MRMNVFTRRRIGWKRILLPMVIFAVITVLKVLPDKPRDTLSLHKTSRTHEPLAFINRNTPILKRRIQPFCEGLFKQDEKVIDDAYEYMRSYERQSITDDGYISKTRDCPSFIQERGYIMKPLSQEENDFPIAYSMLMYKDVEQAERLLRAVYMPQNVYCLHVDLDSPKSVREAMHGIAGCLPNVFIASKLIKVNWGTVSVLEADLNCMEDLLKFKRWKYFINLTGQEMPLLSNRQIVRVLKALNGSNDVDASVKRRNVRRTKYEHMAWFGLPSITMMTFRLKPPPPRDIVLAKGSVHIVAKRGYVQYVIHDPLSKEFREWLRDTWIPDETFFSSLNHNPKLNVPGSYLGEPETDPIKKPYIARLKNWGQWPFDYGPCLGKWVHGICIPGIRDIAKFKDAHELIVNKFHQDFDFLTLDCIEELQFNRTISSAQPNFQFNDSYYRQLTYVRNHL
ncbi:beta-1,3-galactosyl-O-glycosyl-glycoprotein beta-1,6-N-acetylglucosaminyltransferase 3-like isoform X2 [Lineus longissimus]